MQKAHLIVDIFWRFLWLGCISFGGPAAHISYFHKTFVERLRWLTPADYGQLVALSQFLPGPSSSQVGFALGLQRGGLAGGLAAFLGFTLPSFVLMVFLATLSAQKPNWLLSPTYGLKLVAVVVVADAVITMFGHFCQQHITRIMALVSGLILIFINTLWSQIALLITVAIISFGWPRLFNQMVNITTPRFTPQPLKRGVLLLFSVLFVVSLFIQYSLSNGENTLVSMAAQFYQSGSLVFGGGHVVLPLLQNNVGETLANEQFLLGYAAAQGMPGPMFSLAAFLGAQLSPLSPIIGATIATLALFLPGLLLVIALHQHWRELAERPRFAAVATVLNAAVVGLLFSALVTPIFSQAVHQTSDIVALLVGFALIRLLKIPILVVILFFLSYAFFIA